MSKPDYGYMAYSATLDIGPTSELAGVLCDAHAQTVETCGYPFCGESAVAAVVHRERVSNGSLFLGVCDRHLGWERAKLEPSIWDEI